MRAKKNGLDEKARDLYRKAQDDLAAARRWVRHLERLEKGERVLAVPLSRDEIKKQIEENEDRIVTGIVSVNLGSVIDDDVESFLDRLSRMLIGSETLMNIEYDVVDVLQNDYLLIRVSGEVLDEDLEDVPTSPSRHPRLDALHEKLAAGGAELSDGGIIEAEEDGTIRRRDGDGNLMDVVRLGESPPDEWQALADFLDLTPQDFDVEDEDADANHPE